MYQRESVSFRSNRVRVRPAEDVVVVTGPSDFDDVLQRRRKFKAALEEIDRLQLEVRRCEHRLEQKKNLIRGRGDKESCCVPLESQNHGSNRSRRKYRARGTHEGELITRKTCLFLICMNKNVPGDCSKTTNA